MELLEKYQFKQVVLEELSLQEQINLFAGAKVVLAPHGAGLTNLVFCGKGTKVIELFAPEFLSGVYWLICHHADLDYYYIIGERHASASAAELEEYFTLNIQINIAKVKATLEFAEVIQVT